MADLKFEGASWNKDAVLSYGSKEAFVEYGLNTAKYKHEDAERREKYFAAIWTLSGGKETAVEPETEQPAETQPAPSKRRAKK